jgi:hypothetical protein
MSIIYANDEKWGSVACQETDEVQGYEETCGSGGELNEYATIDQEAPRK